MKKLNLNKNGMKGITIISLVITIIILLLLAGISIGALTGENGLINKSQQAKKETEIAKEKELIDQATIQAMRKNRYGNLAEEDLKNELDKIVDSVEVVNIGEGFEVYFTHSKRYYEVNEDGDIENYQIAIEDKNPGDITKDKDGNDLEGTAEHPFEVWNIEDLIDWSNNYNNYKEANIKLCRNLNFKSLASYQNSKNMDYEDINKDSNPETLLEEMQTGLGFTPITLFNGTFNGQGYEIKNIYINSDKPYVGFISETNGATIKKLEISGNINQALAHRDIYYCAGIVGCGNEDSVIENCINNASVTGNSYIGGISGKFSGKIYCCYNKKDIINSYIVGGISGTGEATIVNCYNLGNITSTGTACAAGILGGDYWSSTASIYNCYNKGKIECTAYSIYATPGGIYGYMANPIKSLNIVNCYNIGNIISSYKTKGSIIGNIRVITPTTKNCYYLENVAEQPDIAIPKSQEYLQSKELVDKLNKYIEANEDGIDTKGWNKWKLEENGDVTLDFNETWNGTE